MAIQVLLITAVVALAFYMLGRWSGFKSMKRWAHVTRHEGKSIPVQLTSLNSAVIADSQLKGAGSDFEKYANSIRHREKFNRLSADVLRRRPGRFLRPGPHR
jgi:hypothetical protein